MFLVRTTLLVGLAVLVLPTDPAGQARVFGAARAATQWTLTFCDRNPGTCTAARDGWGLFVKKAEFAASMAYQLMDERAAKAHPVLLEPAAPQHKVVAPDKSKPGTPAAVRIGQLKVKS